MNVWVTGKFHGSLENALADGLRLQLEDVVVWDAGDAENPRWSMVGCFDNAIKADVIAKLQAAGIRFAPEKDGLRVEATGLRIEQVLKD